jgi:hypothetical protein
VSSRNTGAYVTTACAIGSSRSARRIVVSTTQDLLPKRRSRPSTIKTPIGAGRKNSIEIEVVNASEPFGEWAMVTK